MMPRRVNLPEVSYPGESIKNLTKHDAPPGYHALASQSHWGIIPWRVSFFNTTVKFEQLRKIVTKIKNILTHC